jgi:RHS repeat-associated protein
VSGSLDATKNNGNIQSQTIGAPGAVMIQSYTYDAVNRLASAQETTSGKFKWQESYEYDRWGNRTSLAVTGPDGILLATQSTPAVNAATNRLAGGTYDAAGNTITAPGDYNYAEYDAENRMTRFAGTSLRYLYGYDGDGRRVKKINEDGGPETTVFVYNASGQMVAEYTTFQGAPMANVKVSYLTADHLSSTRLVTGSSQNVVARHDFLPFGEEIPAGVSGRSGGLGYGGNDGVRQKFTQKERDSESGLDYFLARYYSSAQGRFTSPDEFKGGPDEAFGPASDSNEKVALAYADITNPQSLNKYSYCYNSPLAFVDPDGHHPLLWAAAAAAASLLLGPNTANAPGRHDPLYKSEQGGNVAVTIAANAAFGAALRYATSFLATSASKLFKAATVEKAEAWFWRTLNGEVSSQTKYTVSSEPSRITHTFSKAPRQVRLIASRIC